MLDDLRFAVRSLVARPAFTLAAVGTLAVGIGATTAIFSTVNAALLRPLPFPESEGLYSLGTGLADGRFSTGLVAPSEMFALNVSAPSVVKAAIVRRTDSTMAGGAEGTAESASASPEAVPIIIYSVSEGFFDLFRLPLAVGQGLAPEHHLPISFIMPRPVPGGPPPAPPVMPQQVAVVAHHVWQEQFGKDPNIVGKSLDLANGRMTIVGVANADFDVPAGADVWTSLRVDRANIAHSYTGYLRVKPGTSPERLQSELTSVMAGVAKEFPTSATGRIYVVRPLVESIVGDLGPMLMLVLFGAILLLLLACVNVTNLLLARGTVRAKEIAVRSALGAGRSRIVRQLLTESLVLATAGTVAGLFLAFVGVRLLLYLGASQLPRLEEVPFDGRVLLFAVVALLVTGLLIGIAPALRLMTTDLRGLLNESGRSATGGRGAQRMLGAMIVAEIAVAITLVAGAGWLVRSFSNLSNTDPGFTPAGRLVFDVVLPAARYGRGGLAGWSQQLSESMRGIGSVTAVGTTSVVPLRPERDVAYYVGMQGEADDPQHQLTARLRSAGPGFFKAMGVRILHGREFAEEDRPGATGGPPTPIAVINNAFARRYLSGRDAVQEQFYWGFPTVNRRTAYRVLGVVDDARYASMGEAAEPTFYLMQSGLQHTVVVASSLADPTPIVASVRSAIKAIDPTLPIHPAVMPDVVTASLSRQRLGVILMMLFAGAALALAAIGIYGVIAYASAQRKAEMATRIALGATPSNVFWMMMNQGRTLSLIGAAIGLAVAYAAGRIVTSRLYEVRASDPVVLIAAGAVVIGITFLAIVIPARRAAQTDPALVLRPD